MSTEQVPNVGAIIDLGRLLCRHKATLSPTDWRSYVVQLWPVDEHLAGMIMEFVRDHDAGTSRPFQGEVLADMLAIKGVEAAMEQARRIRILHDPRAESSRDQDVT